MKRSSSAALATLASSSIPGLQLLGQPQGGDGGEFNISLNQWSLFGSYVGDSSEDDWWTFFMDALRTDPTKVLRGKRDPMDFPRLARESFGLGAIEIEASLYFAQVNNDAYWKEFLSRCSDHDVKCLFISNVWTGNLGSMGERKPKDIAEDYHMWVDLASRLGCHSLMVDVNGRRGGKEHVKEAAIEGLQRLVEYSSRSEIAIIFENHNWYSGDPVWLVDIVKSINSPYCGLTVDFGNFCEGGWRNGECIDMNDPYEGASLMLPYAKSISAKAIRLDENGNDTFIDYERMLKIVKESGYRGYLGVEYSGENYSEIEGTQKTIDLIRRVESRLE